ncbi:hypothetical protein BGX27_005244, partial [Mortierella sp. AM989]
VTKNGLEAVTILIQNHTVFRNNSKHQQTHSNWQLAIAMFRFDRYGNGGSIQDTSIFVV